MTDKQINTLALLALANVALFVLATYLAVKGY